MAKKKSCRPRIGRKTVIRKGLKETGASWDRVKSDTMKRLDQSRRVNSCVSNRCMIVVVNIIVVYHPKKMYGILNNLSNNFLNYNSPPPSVAVGMDPGCAT